MKKVWKELKDFEFQKISMQVDRVDNPRFVNGFEILRGVFFISDEFNVWFIEDKGYEVIIPQWRIDLIFENDGNEQKVLWFNW